MEPESQRKAARDLWTEAQKVYRKLCTIIDALATETAGDWSHLEDIIAKHRLACVQILILDPEFFCETVQGHMWSTHSLINNQYRQVMQRLRNQKNTVARSKLEKLHVRFLKTSFDFYKHYVQQLATKYGIPELEKAARKTNQTSVKAPADNEPMDELSPSLKRGLLLTCAMAIVHIGDLARYLTQARTRKPKKNDLAEKGIEPPLSHSKPKALEPHDYYNLASQLLPSLGHSYHQNGVMYLEEKNDFEVIFHFIKAVAVERQHPMAAHNLDQKFRLLRTTEATTPIASQDPTTILKVWFIRLHGGYFGDVPFARQKAIEREVLGRLKMSIQLHHDAQVTLMKMILINIAAHYIAKTKLASDPDSKNAARTLYLVLRHNIQTFGTILIILKEELIELKQQMPLSDLVQKAAVPTDQAKKRPKGSIVQYICMPLVRLYSSWLVATRNELDNAAEDLSPGIVEMCTYFASVLTLLSEIYGAEDMKITPYLLPEDMLGRGLLPLSSQLLPPACELGFDQDRNVPKADWEDWDQSHGIWSHEKELLARSLDILLCGFNLTEDGPLSFRWTQADTGLKFHYEPPAGSTPISSSATQAESRYKGLTQTVESDSTPDQLLHQKISQTQVLEKTVASQASEHNTPSSDRNLSNQMQALQIPSSHKQAINSSIPQLWGSSAPPQTGNLAERKQMSPHIQADHHRDAGGGGGGQLPDTTYYTGLGSSVWDARFATPYALPADTSVGESTDYDFSNNTAVMDMVNDFLQPPLNPTRGQNTSHSAARLDDTSYGMRSATADEVFNGLAARSPSFAENHFPRAFPGLPWSLVYEPSPNYTDGHTSPNAPATGPFDNSGVYVAPQSMSHFETPAMSGYGSSAGSWQWPEYAAATSGASAGSHRARLLQAFGQPAASPGPAHAACRHASQEHNSERSRRYYDSYAPVSSDRAFSSSSSIYQSTPHNRHTSAFNSKMSSAANAAEDCTDACDELALSHVREDMARERQARSGFI